ncbi:cysteine hydrolase [Neisseriaceae bacterium JH1-16]|nr:cysteine hydrolase [Neisseriaceae bacterium JH1-16]
MSTAPKRALLVIDVQNEYETGALPIEFPPLSTSLPAIGRAIDAARAANVPVIVVQHTSRAGSPVFDKGSDGWRLHPVVASRGYDHYVEKTLPSSFTGTGLAALLAELGTDTLTVIGYMTQNCDDSTVKDAKHRGLAVEVLHDATGAIPLANSAGAATAEQIHQVSMVVMQSNFAAVLSTDDWIAYLASGQLPERSNLLASLQQGQQLAKAV